MLRRDSDGLGPHPVRTGYRLAGKCLEILHWMFRRIEQELANDLDAFVVGDVDGGFVVKRFAMQVLQDGQQISKTSLGVGFCTTHMSD